MDIKQTPVAEITPYEGNPRKIPEAAVSKVAMSIKTYGWQQPIVVDESGVILAGHTRYLAAQQLGMDKVPVQVAEGLTEAQAQAYRLADNRTNQEASWNFELLGMELKGLDSLNFDLDLTGFDPDEVYTAMFGPGFVPGGEDNQGALDQIETKRVTCPNCAAEFEFPSGG